MSAYSITGPSGSGKSTVGRVLKQRGFRIIETDFEDGLSAWFTADSGERVTKMPAQPYQKEWIDAHKWLWDVRRMNELLDSVGDEPVFFCGGAYNEKDFFNAFEMRFGLCTTEDKIIERLKQREPQRYQDGSFELQKQIIWNEHFREYCQKTGAIIIDSSHSSDEVADNILSYIK
jgi:gluconate kinase